MKRPRLSSSQLVRLGWLLLLGLGAGSAGLAPSADGDIWWHLAAGREMVARGGLLFTDPFSVSAAGRAWVDVHWLFQLLSYGVHHLLGLSGLVWLKCALVGAGAVALAAAVQRDRFGAWARPILVTLLLASLLAARQLILVRPVMITLPCLALFFYQLERYRYDGQARRLVVLAGVQVVWANCQGLSALGPAVVAAYAAAAGFDAWLGGRAHWPFAREASPGRQRVKQLSLALVACVCASALTPFGASGLWLPAKLLHRLVPSAHNVYAHTVAENVPPFLLERWSGGEFWHLKWYFAVLGLVLVAGGRRLRLSHALLLASFTALALLSNRNVLLLYWVTAPIAALQLAPAARRVARALGRGKGVRVVLGANAAVVLALLGVASYAAAHESSFDEASPFRAPAESVRRLANMPGGGDVFTADHHGGYLIWQLHPRYRPYIDTRLVLRSAAQYAEYLSLADEPERFDGFQAKWRFDYVLLPVAYPDRYLSLITHLYRSREWRLLYTDGSEVLFGRAELAAPSAWDLSDPSTTDRILAQLESRFAKQPTLLAASRQHLATLHIALGETAQAQRALSSVAGPAADALRARCHFVAGELDAAGALAQRALAREPDDAQSASLLARIALERGELKAGAAWLARALRANPFDEEASQLLGSLEDREP